MRMRDQKVGVNRLGWAYQFGPEPSDARAGIDNYQRLTDSHLDTGSVSAEHRRIRTWDGNRPANPPERDANACFRRWHIRLSKTLVREALPVRRPASLILAPSWSESRQFRRLTAAGRGSVEDIRE